MLKPAPSKNTVLVADDNEGIRELLAAILSEEGYQVVTVKDGEQALNRKEVEPGWWDGALADELEVMFRDSVLPAMEGGNP